MSKNKYVQILIKVLIVILQWIEGILSAAAVGFTVLVGCSVSWLFQTWPYLNMEELVYQLNAPMEGTNLSMVKDYINHCIPVTLVAVIAVIFVMVVFRGKNRYHIFFGLLILVSAAGTAGSLYYMWDRLDVKNYSENQSTYSTFIDDNYVDPNGVSLTFPEKKRNLIYIFLESMETTYADIENGGGFDENYMPELTELAQTYEDFSGEALELNGGISMPSTTWTIAAMFAQSSGLPLTIPVEDNSMDQQETFFPGISTIGDILEDAGYNQTLLIGSDATFGGRRNLYSSHGNFSIVDYNYAVENQLIPSDYRVWWGYEDEKLFDFAKAELRELAAQEEPFNLTMLTVDTHFEDGYYCQICEDEYPDNTYANVIACSSRQVMEFVEWIQRQDFYENTTIVISGDHPTMDSDFCDDVDDEYVRKVYTTYINSAVEPEDGTQARKYTTFDNFPTTLASLGVAIEGNRLGLGTNLFSKEYTLPELYSVDRMKSEIRKKSKLMEEFTSDIVVETEPEDNGEAPTAILSVDEYNFNTGILPLYISEIDDKGMGISAINVAVWVADDQSDIQWMQAEQQPDGSYYMGIEVPSFDWKTGDYKIDVYLVDGQGEQRMIGNIVGHVE